MLPLKRRWDAPAGSVAHSTAPLLLPPNCESETIFHDDAAEIEGCSTGLTSGGGMEGSARARLPLSRGQKNEITSCKRGSNDGRSPCLQFTRGSCKRSAGDRRKPALHFEALQRLVALKRHFQIDANVGRAMRSQAAPPFVAESEAHRSPV